MMGAVILYQAGSEEAGLIADLAKKLMAEMSLVVGDEFVQRALGLVARISTYDDDDHGYEVLALPTRRSISGARSPLYCYFARVDPSNTYPVAVRCCNDREYALAVLAAALGLRDNIANY